MDGEFCDIKKCRGEAHLTYTKDGGPVDVCKKHWLRHCDDNDEFDLNTAEAK